MDEEETLPVTAALTLPDPGQSVDFLVLLSVHLCALLHFGLIFLLGGCDDVDENQRHW